ncbi:hypothetical protein JJJ17_10290 [Paracoccus caeni]|uniref:YHS domain-containing protein n=1 Tax=Paracoccus caeni TaxID=657651 RepID=A0A934W104_9RHOB|nr:YHS domain-containing (seleno)protein [Paracoccus caeni]MBK4216314.1 hypothetical protein [Paracoccus caeni]
MKPLILPLMLLAVPALPSFADDWAVDGYDAVGFLESGRAMPGRSDIATTWKGQVWHFTSEENRARFESDPRSFAPEFDGLCPVMLAAGRAEPGDPEYFTVFEDRVYLMRSDAALQEFTGDPQGILARAEQNFARLK